MGHKDGVVKANVDGVSFLFKKNKIDAFQGTGKVVSAGKVAVTNDKGETQEIEAKNIVIATGSDVAGIPGVQVDIDENVIVSSTGAIALSKVPEKLIVVGGGVIGLELGSVWSRLGAKVTVVEYLDNILGGMDGEVSKQAQRLLAKQGLDFKLGAKVTAVEKTGAGAKVVFEPVKGGAAETLEANVVLISTGRKPYTEGLGLAEAGVVLDSRGRVEIDGHYKTNVDGIYAIGDVVKGPMLAHKAEDEGVALAEILAGQRGHVNYDVIPAVVYTQPEIASVGKTEEELKAAGIAYKVGKFPFTANGRARAMQVTDGFVKILADKGNRSGSRRSYRRLWRWRNDPRNHRADGIRWFFGRSRPHLPCASDHVGSGEGSSAGDLLQADPHVIGFGARCSNIKFQSSAKPRLAMQAGVFHTAP